MSNNQTNEEIADAALEAQDWNRAVEYLSRALKDNPNDHTLYGKRAKAFLEMGPLTAMYAIPDAQRSCMMEPSYIDGFVLFSKANILAGSLWTAEVVIRKGLLFNPEDPNLMAQLERAQQARNDPSIRPKITILPIWDAPDEYGFVYTQGLHWHNVPELLMVDVPSKMIPAAVDIIGSVALKLQAGESVAHGDIVGLDDRNRAQVFMVSEEANRSAMMNIVGQWNEEAEVTLLKLLDEDNPPEPRERESLVPPAPDGNENRLKSILDKWRDVESFTFFVDGDQENESDFNRMSVPLSFMLERYKSSVNWDATLTHEEGQYAWSNWDDVRHHARADLQGIGYALDGHYIRNIVRHAVSPTMVQSRYRQGVRLASED